MIRDIINDAEDRMKKSMEHLTKDLASLRAGRANPAMVEKLSVDYYGVGTPINQLANITVPEARLLVIQPWDKSIIADIEKSIMKSDLGITPSNDGNVIRIAIPQLTEERRKELTKVARGEGENTKVAVRNLRRDANEHVKRLLKDKLVSEDDERRAQDDIQKLTDRMIAEVDKIVSSKEQDIMAV